MTKYIETYQNGKKLLGSDFTTVIREFTPRKAINAMKKHTQRIESLKNIKPYLKNGYILKINS